METKIIGVIFGIHIGFVLSTLYYQRALNKLRKERQKFFEQHRIRLGELEAEHERRYQELRIRLGISTDIDIDKDFTNN